MSSIIEMPFDIWIEQDSLGDVTLMQGEPYGGTDISMEQLTDWIEKLQTMQAVMYAKS